IEKQMTIRETYTNGNPFVLFVGAIHGRKNLPRLLKAFQSLKDNTDIPHHLLIVGEPMWRKKGFSVEPSIKPFVHFTGHLQANRLALVMASASCLAFVSCFEGFGIPIVEAMRA